MAKKYLARKNGQWMVVSIVPDVCKTPVGPAVVPVPYPVTALLSSAEQVSPNVRANGDPVVIFNKSFIPTTMGDQAGTATGVKSNTVGAKCYPKAHSKSVNVNKKRIIRRDDEFWMNG